MIKKEPREIWEEYKKGVDYNAAIDLYETVRINENFYIGKQWEGVNAPDLPKPVMNIMKRVIAHQTAMIVSDDVGISFTAHYPTDQAEQMAAIFASEVERVIEQAGIKSMHRGLIRNASVDGDACMYLYFDPGAETGQEAQGDVRAESIENINVIFGNPYLCDVQKQPYIIIAQRRTLSDVRAEAEENGSKYADNIAPDSDPNQGEAGSDNDLVTVLIKFWREDKTVWVSKTTESVVVKEPTDTDMKLYPIAWMPWETIRSSYHGQASITGLIPNQIAINRLYAMMIRSVEMNAFPKLVYDSSKIQSWSNRVGEAIAVTSGGVTDAITTAVRGADVSPQVMQVIESTVSMTRDFMGASDAALGNVKPDNTSAIIAVQQASNVPLELQRRAFYAFVEDYARIIVDIMRAYYGQRTVVVTDQDIIKKIWQPEIDPLTGMAVGAPPKVMEIPVDFGMLGDANMRLKVDVGSAAYWSEIMQMQTLDNLMAKGIIQDAELFVESIPAKYLSSKNKILTRIQEQKAQMQQQIEMQQAIQTPTAMPTGETIYQQRTAPKAVF